MHDTASLQLVGHAPGVPAEIAVSQTSVASTTPLPQLDPPASGPCASAPPSPSNGRLPMGAEPVDPQPQPETTTMAVAIVAMEHRPLNRLEVSMARTTP